MNKTYLLNWTPGTRPEAEPQVRDRGAVQDAEHRAGVPGSRQPVVAGRPDPELRTQVANAAGKQPGTSASKQ
jgi:hypothetical protein